MSKLMNNIMLNELHADLVSSGKVAKHDVSTLWTLRHNGMALEQLTSPTREMCIMAVSSDPHAIIYVPACFIDEVAPIALWEIPSLILNIPTQLQTTHMWDIVESSQASDIE